MKTIVKALLVAVPLTLAATYFAVGQSGVAGVVRALQAGTWTVQPGNTANTTPWLATINQGGTSATVGTYGTAPGAVGALNVNANVTNANTNPTPLKLNALSTTVTAIKASAGGLFMLQCGNTNASQEYVQIFNVASGSVTLGTTAPTLSVPIAATSTGGFALSMPMTFGTAISAAATTTATGLTAPGTALDCNVAFN